MEKETLLFIGVIGLVLIVFGFMAFSWLTTPLNPKIEGDNVIISLEDCENAGFSKDQCFKLSPNQLKKVLRKKNG